MKDILKVIGYILIIALVSACYLGYYAVIGFGIIWIAAMLLPNNNGSRR